MSTVIRNNQDTIYIDKKKLEELKILAQNDPNKRARICLHKNDEEMVQEIGKFDISHRIEFLEKKLIDDMNNETFQELLDLKNQVNQV